MIDELKSALASFTGVPLNNKNSTTNCLILTVDEVNVYVFFFPHEIFLVGPVDPSTFIRHETNRIGRHESNVLTSQAEPEIHSSDGKIDWKVN